MGFRFHPHLGHWLSNAVMSAGRDIGSAAHTVSTATGKIGTAISRVPFIGPGLHGLWGIVGIEFAFTNVLIRIASGQRVDKALIGFLKTSVQSIHELAPYIQTLIALVPAVGPGVSAAIGGGLALASGESIDQAMIDAAAGAIPGGAIAASLVKAGASVVKDAIAGKPLLQTVEDAGLAALPLDATQKKLVHTAFQVTQDLVTGKNVDKAVMDAANGALSAAGLPDTVTKAIKVGLALGNGAVMQGVAKAHSGNPDFLDKLAAKGQAVAATDATVKAARVVVRVGQYGFDVGVGMMQFQTGITAFTTARNALKADDKKGFDMGVSLHVGRVTAKAPSNANAGAQAGFYLTRGMMGAPPANKVAMMQAIAANPDATIGAKAAIVGIAAARKTWWVKVKEFFGLAKAA